MDIFFQKVGAAIVAIAIAVGSWLGFVPEPSQDQQKLIEIQQEANKIQQQILEIQRQIDEGISLGSYTPVGGKYYSLQSGLTSSATSIVLNSFKMPISDQEFAMSDFGGTIGYGTLEPNNLSNVEFISFTGITQNASNDQATLTGVSRGLSFTYPYSASTTLQKSHSGGSRFIITNPPIHYGEYTAKRNDETIEGDWTYSATNTPQYNEAPSFTSASQEFASIKFVEDTANQGAATSSEIQGGIIELGDSSELGAGTATGTTGYSIVLQNRFATSTPYATTSIPVTGTDGKLAQGFIDLTEPWNFTASTTFSATTTIGDSSDDYLWVNASTTFNATTTFKNATTTFDRQPKIDPNSPNATSTDFYSLMKVGGFITLGDTTSSDYWKNSNDTATNTDRITSIKLKETKLNADLAGARISFDMQAGVGQTGYGRIYKNGVGIGTPQSTVVSANYTTFSEDFSGLVTDDLIQLYASTSNATNEVLVKNLRFSYQSIVTHIGIFRLATSTDRAVITTGPTIPMTNQDP